MGDSNVWPENLAKCFDLKSLRNLGGFEEEEAYEFAYFSSIIRSHSDIEVVLCAFLSPRCTIFEEERLTCM